MDREELEEYEAIAETASVAFVTIDEVCVIQSVNPAVESIFGYGPDELVDEPLTVLMPETFCERHFESLQRYLDTGERNLDWEYIELPGLDKEDHEIPLAIAFNEYEYDGDQFFTSIIRDNTARKRLEGELTETIERVEEVNRQLQVSNERLEEFSAISSTTFASESRRPTRRSLATNSRRCPRTRSNSRNYSETSPRMRSRIVEMTLLEFTLLSNGWTTRGSFRFATKASVSLLSTRTAFSPYSNSSTPRRRVLGKLASVWLCASG